MLSSNYLFPSSSLLRLHQHRHDVNTFVTTITPRGWMPWTQKLRSHLFNPDVLRVPTLNSEEGQNTVLNASPADKNSAFLNFGFPSSVNFGPSSSITKESRRVDSSVSDCCLWFQLCSTLISPLRMIGCKISDN